MTILPALLYHVIGIVVPAPSPVLGLLCVALVDLDDRYDMAEYDEAPVEHLDREALTCCRAVALRGE